MTKIEAIIRPEKLDEVLEAIQKIGYSGVMITEIRGHGKQKGLVQSWRGDQYRVSFLTKIKVEIVTKDTDVEKLSKVIVSAARTGEIGDGKIFTYEIKETTRIRTGEKGKPHFKKSLVTVDHFSQL